jgi:hypothetical protein
MAEDAGYRDTLSVFPVVFQLRLTEHPEDNAGLLHRDNLANLKHYTEGLNLQAEHGYRYGLMVVWVIGYSALWLFGISA